MGKVAAPSSVYWIGADGNVYVKDAKGVQNYGKAVANNANGVDAALGSVQAKQIDDPNPPTPTTTFDATATNGSSGGTAPVDLSSYDQSINATNDQINNLTPSLNNLLSGAQDAYQTTMNDLNQSKASADQTYKLDKTNDAQGYAQDKNTIRTNTGSTINGIDSLLGERGGGGQSAGAYADLLAGRAGTGQLTDAGTTFAKNEQGLDTNYNNFLTGYNTNVNNAGLTKTAAIDNAQASIATQKANLLQSLASLINERTSASGGTGTAASQPYVDQANALLGQAATEGAPQSVGAITPTTYTAPSLLSYTTNPTTVSAGGNAATDTRGSFAPAILSGAATPN